MPSEIDRALAVVVAAWARSKHRACAAWHLRTQRRRDLAALLMADPPVSFKARSRPSWLRLSPPGIGRALVVARGVLVSAQVSSAEAAVDIIDE